MRRERDDLRRHLDLYAEHIRRLTIENAHLTERLADTAGVIDLQKHREARR